MNNTTHVVYLKPIGAGGFRVPLRSDTLWPALCWAIRMVFDRATLENFLEDYKRQETESQAFFLSSAFLFKEDEKGNKIHFFPAPLLPFRASETGSLASLSPRDIKLTIRGNKKKEKLAGLLSKPHLEYVIGAGQPEIPKIKPPTLLERAMTHNTIDRIIGSTLTLNERGQLFHMDEYYIPGTNSGLFFLLRGNLELVKPALRFLEHFGIGGDRSTGKGRFEISEPIEFTVAEPSEPNAVMTLSLYHPDPSELAFWKNSDKILLNYRFEDRQGRNYFQGERFLHNRSLMFFKEGSVFPLIPGRDRYGKNEITARHREGFDIQRYGFGFMINVKIS
jgi:CRISPR-associated protein Csm4